jgi:TRAP-type C4-dicarboxylate transport system permease small subunit
MSDHPVSVLQSIGDFIAKVLLSIAASALFAIIALNGVNIALRYSVGLAFSWAEEVLLYLMILMIFAGATTAAWLGVHIQLDMLLRQMPLRLQQLCITLTGILSIGLLLFLSASSYQVVSAMFRFSQRSVALELPMWIPQGCVTTGFVLMALMTGLRLFVFGAKLSKSEAEEYVERNS